MAKPPDDPPKPPHKAPSAVGKASAQPAPKRSASFAARGGAAPPAKGGAPSKLQLAMAAKRAQVKAEFLDGNQILMSRVYIPQKFVGICTNLDDISRFFKFYTTAGIQTCVALSLFSKDKNCAALTHLDDELSVTQPGKSDSERKKATELYRIYITKIIDQLGHPKDLIVYIVPSKDASSKILAGIVANACSEGFKPTELPAEFIKSPTAPESCALNLETGIPRRYINESAINDDFGTLQSVLNLPKMNTFSLHYLEKEEMVLQYSSDKMPNGLFVCRDNYVLPQAKITHQMYREFQQSVEERFQVVKTALPGDLVAIDKGGLVNLIQQYSVPDVPMPGPAMPGPSLLLSAPKPNAPLSQLASHPPALTPPDPPKGASAAAAAGASGGGAAGETPDADKGPAKPASLS